MNCLSVSWSVCNALLPRQVFCVSVLILLPLAALPLLPGAGRLWSGRGLQLSLITCTWQAVGHLRMTAQLLLALQLRVYASDSTCTSLELGLAVILVSGSLGLGLVSGCLTCLTHGQLLLHILQLNCHFLQLCLSTLFGIPGSLHRHRATTFGSGCWCAVLP